MAATKTRSGWAESVKEAKLAMIKTFEGRMTAAKASFKQIPPMGKDAKGKTLAEFAADAEISYSALTHYRQVWEWIGGDFAYVSKIRSFSIAIEAIRTGRWKTAKQFIAERDKTELPEGFERWTLDAVRVALLDTEPSNTGKLQSQAVESGKDADEDEIATAGAEDQVEDAISTPKSPENREKVRKKAKKPKTKMKKPDPTIDELLMDLGVHNTPSDLWRIMEITEDSPPATGEHQVQRLAKVDAVIQLSDLSLRMAQFLRKLIEHDPRDPAIQEELEAMSREMEKSDV